VSGSLDYGAPLPVAEVKAAGSGDGWEVAGYASTWDRDLGGDVVHPGAFRGHLEGGAKVRFLYAHDPAQVLGRALELREDDRGLFGRFRISQTRLGQDVHTLLRDGSLDSFSIGFIPRDFERDEKSGVRNLKAVELVECSVVAMPMNPAAVVTAVKAADYAALGLEQLLDLYKHQHLGALSQAKAIAARRLSEGRRLSDPALATLEHLRALCEADAAELLRLATTPPARKEDDPAPVKTAGHEGLVEAHLRRARLRDLGRIYGVKTA
jgi:HK97 family phage prohead protease